MSGKVAGDAMEGAIEAVAKGIVKEISGIDFDAGGVVKSKGIDKFATLTEGWGKERHQCVKGKCIGKDRFVTAIEITARNSRSIEGKAHVRETRADKLSGNSWIM